MLKKNRFILTVLITFHLCLVNSFADDAEVKKSILTKFQQIFELKLGQGDKVAKELAERAKKNAGNLKLEEAEMKKLMLKWDPTSKSLFSQLETKEEKLNKLKEKFETLLKKKVTEEDPIAVRIAEKGEFNSGSLSLTVRQMRELISKWEK